VVKLVYTADLKSAGSDLAGSSPAPATIKERKRSRVEVKTVAGWWGWLALVPILITGMPLVSAFLMSLFWGRKNKGKK
jgi:hypothetical protein